MYFGIYGRDEVDDIVLNGKRSILVRILSTFDYESFLETKDLYSDILCLYIDDISIGYVSQNFRIDLLNSFIKLNNFILKNDFDEIIVHCTLGISRSPAIMICIARILGCLEMEKIILDRFSNFNRAIVSEFEKYNFVKKNVEYDELIFKGHFINIDEYHFDNFSNGDVFEISFDKHYTLKRKK